MMTYSDPGWSPVWAKYFASLGAFVAAHAEIENTIRRLLLSESGLPERKLEALLQKTPSVAPTIEMLRSLIQISEMPGEHRKALEDVFFQLGRIRALRERLVHHGGDPLDSERVLIRPLWKHRHSTTPDEMVFTYDEISAGRL